MMMRSILSVTTEATSRKLGSLDQIKAELKITTGEGDDVLNALIDQASAFVESYCGRVLVRETVSEQFRAPPGGWCGAAPERLTLARYPVVSITSVIEGTGDDAETLDADEYEVDAGKGYLTRLDGNDNLSTWTASKIVAAYVAGYIAADLSGSTVPADLQSAVGEMVKSAWHARSRDPMVRRADYQDVGETEWWVGGFSGTGAAGLPPKVTAVLDLYRGWWC